MCAIDTSDMCVFDTSFDYKTDVPGGNRRDPDRYSPRLRSHHELLWTKRLRSGVLFEPKVPTVLKDRRNNYLKFKDTCGAEHVYGSDAITSSYTRWSRPKSLVAAIAGLDENQRSRYLNPPYTIGSAMIWPVRAKDRPTMNQARGFRLSIADRMDLTLECIRRYYRPCAREPENPLADVITAYADFFELFEGFTEFVDFFHFQDLVTPDYQEVRFFLDFNGFKRSGLPATTEQYVTYREAVLEFIAGRGRRMAECVTEYRPECEVRCPWSQPPRRS